MSMSTSTSIASMSSALLPNVSSALSSFRKPPPSARSCSILGQGAPIDSQKFHLRNSFVYNFGTLGCYTLSFSKRCSSTRVLVLPWLSHQIVSKNGKPKPHCQSFRRSLSRSCQVKNEHSDTTPSGDGIVLDEQTLERDLQVAIEEENYARAAKIRDSLRFLHADSRASVLAANTRFYNAFRNGDLTAMQALWAKRDSVCCVHPGVSGISGYDLVMGSWEYVCAEYEFPLDIEVKDVEIHVRGDLGYVTCMEVVKTKGRDWGKQFATNLFERIDGQWFICIHHASPIDV